MFSLLRSWVKSLVGELRSHKPWGPAKKRERDEARVVAENRTPSKVLVHCRGSRSSACVFFLWTPTHCSKHQAGLGKTERP